MLFWIILIILIVLLIASVPVYPYSRGWGYSPAGLLLLVALILLLLWLFGVIDFNGDDDNGTALLQYLALRL